MSHKRLIISLIIMVSASFITLLYGGREIYLKEPPIPKAYITKDNHILFTEDQIKNGQKAWQSIGGQELGSVWGHGSYVAPDWSADWLHKEAVALQEIYSQKNFKKSFNQLDDEKKEIINTKVKLELRRNTYDKETGLFTLSKERSDAIKIVYNDYYKLFSSDKSYQNLREKYAIQENILPSDLRREQLLSFFFWSAWSCVTERPGEKISYTNNWPHDPLVGNTPTTSAFIWSFVSILFLIGGIGALVWYYASHEQQENIEPPKINFLKSITITPSMKSTLKYFYIVVLLFLLQAVFGIITAHYGVEGQAFYGFPLADYLPYSLTRTWHNQLGIFWIATAWLATGLFIAPLISGFEPKYQKLGVDFLFYCLIVIVLGSFIGQWFTIQQKLGFSANFWFGHQGYQYVDLGRFWQIFLFIGLILWLILMIRAIIPIFKKVEETKSIIFLFLISCVAIALFYGAGFMWGQTTHYARVEYWRWWVVHLWVEGFFEIFATTVISFLSVKLNLITPKFATKSILFSTFIFLIGGILGTFHHLYFTGTPTVILALGSSFSALEVVPLSVVGFEAYSNYKSVKDKDWIKPFKWPIYFFIAVAFWNLVGAGVFGFFINPPIALYYMQGLNTTPVHGHSALFGVYGFLGLGLMFFCLKILFPNKIISEKLMSYIFWSLNIGLAAMVLISLLPVGLIQLFHSINTGFWYARSVEVMQTDLVNFFKWLRVFGDSLFFIGILLLVWSMKYFTIKKRKKIVTKI
ncbi:nitric-oxide reductase large subunit [Fluviispira vulneris]|uniref:nitric-oxide reductase large subunit n=1 Tax=Fluviispira vulneris TaxID=2763012 RepID=UPI00164505F7|nr:nitric-oxide reductase large subunit [Fluviispira vulneris]